MLIGLLRLRRRGSPYELWHFLWKQVGHRQFFLGRVIDPLVAFVVHEGVIWFVVAAIAEFPPAVSLASFIVPE